MTREIIPTKKIKSPSIFPKKLHVLRHNDSKVKDAISQLSGSLINRGSTAHFNVFFDSSLGANGQALADAELATCESDYDRIQSFFPHFPNQAFLLETGTPISIADAANFQFALGDFNRDGIPDLFCIKTKNTGTNSLEVHVLSGAKNYQSFLLETGTPISVADAANFQFAVGDFNRDGIPDLYCIKTKNTGTNSLEVHVLNGANNYQSFLLETGTHITQADAINFKIVVGDYNRDGIPDLFCLKQTSTGTNSLEVHVLNGANNYQSFLLETGTPISQADSINFRFGLGDFNRDGFTDLFCIKQSSTGTQKLEVHVLSGANNYQSFLLQTPTPITQADAPNFLFGIGDFNRDGHPDLYCVKINSSGTSTLEVHILNGSLQYLGGLHFTVNIVPGASGASHASCSDTTLNCDAFAGNNPNLQRMLVVAEADEVFMDAQGNGWNCGASNGEGLSRIISAELYPGAQAGFVTGPTWLGGSRPDWVSNNEGTDRDFVSIGCSTLFINYLHYQLGYSWTNIIGTGGSTLGNTYSSITDIKDSGFKPFSTFLQQYFPVGAPVNLSNDNPFPLSAFSLQTGTPITQADAPNFMFTLGDFNRDGKLDLFCIKPTNTGTNRLEVHILNGANNFQTFFLETGTPITSQDATNYLFAMGDYNRDGLPDLYCLKHSNTGTGKLEVHVLSGASNYQSFLLETGTPITQADAINFQFAVGDYNKDGIPDLYCIKKSSTGTGTLEVHVLNGANNFQSFLLETGTPITQADAVNFRFAVADYNKDGIPDLYCLKQSSTGTNSLEVHILNGSNNYQSFLIETGTEISQADASNFLFAVGDFNNDGLPDVYCMKNKSTGTNSLEVHVLNGGAGYNKP